MDMKVLPFHSCKPVFILEQIVQAEYPCFPGMCILSSSETGILMKITRPSVGEMKGLGLVFLAEEQITI